MEDGASLEDLLRVAHSDLKASNGSAAKRNLGRIDPAALAVLEAEARHEGRVILPGNNWNFMVALWTQVGEFKYVEKLIKSMFSIGELKIQIDESIGDEKFRFTILGDNINIFISFKCLEFRYLLIVYRIIEIMPMVKYLIRGLTRPLSAQFSVSDVGCGGELSFSSEDPKAILVPDNYFVGRNAYESERRHFAARRMAWRDRSTAVFWRGATTGRRSDGWRSLPRIKLCQLARDNPQVPMDFGINQVAQQDYPEEENDIILEQLMKPFVSSDHFDSYRYHIDIDGNSNSWPGLFIKLLSGGAVLKVASQHGYRQWYYDQLVPWVHYIPIAADLSDLIEKVGWTTSHDDKARRIGQAGRAFALRMTLGTEAQRMVSTVLSAMKSGVLT